MDAAYLTLQARLDSFAGATTKSRRTSSRSKGPTKAPKKGGWPLAAPTPHDLALAGFIFKPTSASPDNVQCFHCQTQLDGWEESDFPAHEHLTHSPHCAFAINVCIKLRNGDPGRTEDDPLSGALLDARRRTFANAWPLDIAAGYPSVEKLALGGWVFDPTEDEPDGTTCPYCCLALDAWDIGDDPTEEHRKRSADCLFFALKDIYHPTVQQPTAARGKRVSSRSSTASKKATKTARPKKTASKEDLNKPLPLPPDESVMGSFADAPAVEESFAISTTSAPGKKAVKGRKAKKAVAAEEAGSEIFAESYAIGQSFADSVVSQPTKKGRKGKKTAVAEDAPTEVFAESVAVAESFAESVVSQPAKRGRPKKAPISDEASIAESYAIGQAFTESLDSQPAKKGRKPKKAPTPEPVPLESFVEPIAEPIVSVPAKAPAPKVRKTKQAAKRTSTVSTASAARSTRHNKRTSDTMEADDEASAPSPKRTRISDMSGMIFDESTPLNTPQAFPMPPVAVPIHSPSPATPPQPQTPELASTPKTNWEPINVDDFFEKRDIFGIVSNVIVDSGLDKENMDIDMKDAPEIVTKAVKAGLTSPEKKMSVEEWVLYNAKRGEEKLRMECERQIVAFEGEGRRALAALDAY